ncbi:hypothetical protein B0H16DRAFT_1549139 [Mycena metata]|uniref:Uncharacterized protein n=1 Tax=Mycena metata TaxID=1033252 RepID=A0AAD7IXI6_9AGAR|nr:hypothetical protein B0H16DRAFT_1549139 [Mycena metata]
MSRLDLDHPVEHLFVAHPYVVTFAPKATDIWVLNAASTLQHYTRLQKTLSHPGALTPILDDSLNPGLLAIADVSGDSPELCVFSLEYGTLLRTLWLYGDLAPSAPRYAAGRALIGTTTPDKSELFLLDVERDGWILGTAQLPFDLSRAASLDAVHLKANEDEIAIVGAAVAHPGQADDITLLLWRGIPPEDAQPVARLVLPLRMPDVDTVAVTCSTSLSTSTFVFSAYESVSDAINTKYSRLSVIRAIDMNHDALALRWEAPPEALPGYVSQLVHVPAAHAVVAIGSRNAREDAGEDIPLTFVAVLDDETGALRRQEDVQEAVCTCRVVQGKVVCVWKSGEVSTVEVLEFVQRGLPMGNSDGTAATVRQAGVLDGVVVLLGETGKIRLEDW